MWDEIRALEDSVRDGAVLPEARAVAAEMMARVRQNLERLVEVLKKKKYAFAAGSAAKALPGPDAKTAKALDAVEKILGAPLPVSLRAFYEVVGPVSLAERGGSTGFFAVYGAFDPLVVTPIALVLEQLKKEQQESAGFAPALRPRLTRLYLGPDPTHKEDPGEGDEDSYEIELDGEAADGIVRQGDRSLLFVDYLRQIVAAGGFLKLPDQPQDETHAQREALTKGALAF